MKDQLEKQSLSRLQSLFQAIARAADEDELRSQVAPKIGEHFSAARSGIFFFDQVLSDNRDLNPSLKKVIEAALSTERNPIARYIAERHAPAHNGLVTSPKAWRLICPRPDHWHVMAGPIVSRGKLIGVLGCTREKSQMAFDSQDLADASAVCLHLSVWAATLRSQPKLVDSKLVDAASLSSQLTAREREIAELVAIGKKNAEVGAELWITENSVKQALKKIFRKLGVSSRTEMAMQLLVDKQTQ